MDEHMRYLIEFIAQITGEKDIQKLKKEISSISQMPPAKVKIDFSSGKEVKDYITKLKKETGEDWKIKIRYIHDPKKESVSKIIQKELEKEAGLILPEPKNIQEWKTALTGLGSNFDKLHTIANVSLTKIAQTGKETAKTFKIHWIDKTGREYQTTVSGIVRGNNLIRTSLKTVSSEASSSAQLVNVFVKAFKRVAIVVPIWFVFRKIFMSTIDLIKNSMNFLVDWEQQLARIRIVGKGTEGELRALSSALLILSKNLGVSTKDLGKAAVLWAQQGRAISEIIPLMESTARLSLITGRTMTQSVEDLTSIMKSYKLEAEDTGRVIDSVTNVMLNHAVTANVLVEALRQVAPVARQFNISFEQILGIITATHAVTRSKGSTIGRAWRTIFSRMATSGTQAIQEIAKIPVYLDEQGKASDIATYRMRNLGDILTEIALKWNTLTRAQKINLAQALSGKRRITELMAFLGNYNEALKAHIDAMFAVGKADKSVAILTDTLANRLEALSGSWKSFVETIGDTNLIKNSVSLLTNGLSFLAEMINPLQANYNKFINSIKESNKALQKQMSVANAQLQVWREAKHLAQFFEREPELAKQLESRYVRMYIQAMKQAGIEVDNTINSMQDLADFMEKRMPEVVDTMTDAIHNKMLNKIKTDIQTTVLQIEKMLIPLKNAIEASTQTRFGGVNTDAAKQLQIINSAFEKMRNNEELSNKEISVILKYFRDTSKTSQEWLAKLKLVRDYMTQIRKLNQEIKDDTEAKIEAETKVGSMIKEQTTTMITAEQARKRISAIEKEALQNEEERIVTVKKILDFLNKENISYDDSLKRLKERLEKEQISLSIQEKHKKIRDKIADIEIQGLEAGKSRLQILKDQYNYLSNYDIKSNATLKKEAESLELQIKRLEAQQQLNILKEQENILLDQMRAYGATDLQLEIQKYEIMKARGADAYEMTQQALKVQKQLIDDINSSATELGNIFSNAFEELFLGEKKAGDIFDDMIDSLRKDIAQTLGESLKNQIFQVTGIGELYGRTMSQIKNTTYGGSIGIKKGFIDGSQYAYKYIVNAHMKGAEYFARLQERSMVSFQNIATASPLTTGAGAIGSAILNPNATSTTQGFWNGMTPTQGLTAFLMGAFAGSGGGVLPAIGSGMSSLLMMAGHPLLALPFMLLSGITKSKTTHQIKEYENQVAPKIDITNKQLEIVNRNLLALRNDIRTYMLPTSAYFAEKTNIEDQFSLNARRGIQ